MEDDLRIPKDEQKDKWVRCLDMDNYPHVDPARDVMFLENYGLAPIQSCKLWAGKIEDILDEFRLSILLKDGQKPHLDSNFYRRVENLKAYIFDWFYFLAVDREFHAKFMTGRDQVPGFSGPSQHFQLEVVLLGLDYEGLRPLRAKYIETVKAVEEKLRVYDARLLIEGLLIESRRRIERKKRRLERQLNGVTDDQGKHWPGLYDIRATLAQMSRKLRETTQIASQIGPIIRENADMLREEREWEDDWEDKWEDEWDDEVIW